MKLLYLLSVFSVLSIPLRALDREAFTFTHYDLNVRIEPEQQRLGVRGSITLRNDSGTPQRIAVFQISSSLHWLSIRVEHRPAEYVTETYTSDIDHTGALTEAIVTLPRAVEPKQTIEFEVGYEGVIPQDATRLTRIGVPASTAKHSDWDQISSSFTAVRGIGYVTWYPIAAESANLSEAETVSDTVGRWKRREENASMRLCMPNSALMNDVGSKARNQGASSSCVAHEFSRLQQTVPVFAMGSFVESQLADVVIQYLPEHKAGADDYALAIEQVVPWLRSWLGDHRAKDEKAQVIDLPDPGDSLFETGTLLLIPLATSDTAYLLAAVHQLTTLMFPSPRQWISGGLALYAQARYEQDQKGAAAGLAYLQGHEAALLDSEKQNPGSTDPSGHSLLNADDEFCVQSKAMAVWWMLHDMIGDAAFSASLQSYQADQDTAPEYMQKRIEAQAHRDFSWFFRDWVYQDHGLPDFRIDSVFVSTVPSGGALATVTVENRGGAAAEVPVTLHLSSGEVTDRLLVAGKSKATVRMFAARTPIEAVVNDGSVPETDLSNNLYKITSSNR